MERRVCFYFSSGSRTEPRSGLPIFIALQRRHRDLEKQSRDSFELGRTHFFSLSEEERALCRGQSLSHERKRGIMPDGSLLFPEGGGELPPYANARNWPRPPPISRHGASQLSFAARETDVAPCITSGKLKLPHHQRRYLFYSPLCVLSRVKGSKIDTSVKRVRRLLPTPPLFNRPRTQMCRHWRAGVPQNMHFPL